MNHIEHDDSSITIKAIISVVAGALAITGMVLGYGHDQEAQPEIKRVWEVVVERDHTFKRKDVTTTIHESAVRPKIYYGNQVRDPRTDEVIVQFPKGSVVTIQEWSGEE